MLRILKITVLVTVLGFLIMIGIKSAAKFPEQNRKGQLQRIDRFMPDFDYILGLSGQTQKPNQIQLTRYTKYYEFIKKQNVQDEATNEILAFCYFYQGQTDKAQKLYLQAIQNNRRFFWSLYNLGMIKMSQKDFTGAADAFQKALNIPPEETMEHLFSLKSYLQIIISKKLPSEALAQSLQAGYQKSLQYLELIKTIESTSNPSENKKIKQDLSQHARLILF